MPPKKQQQQQKSKSKSAPKSKPQASAPKLQISAENERRLRRLLLNTERPAGAPPPPVTADTASRAQKAKRLRSVYDKLSLEGFSADQIEQALSALSDTASFETALDWLCLNITGSELPLKFSSAGSSVTHEGTEREVKIISIARTDWVPSQRVADESQVDLPTVRMRGRRDEVSLDSDKASQADWIRQYMEQEEEEPEEEEDDPKVRAASIGQEYRYARLGAIEAKRKGDKKRQDHFSDVIYKLKQEVSSLGLSESILDFQDESALDDLPLHFLESNAPDDPGSQLDVNALTNGAVMYTNGDECSNLRQAEAAAGLSDSPSVEVGQNNDEPDELELDNLFSEDSASHGAIPSGISRYPMKGKSPELAYGHMLGNIDDIWKKGDSGKIPKAVLQKLCQKLGWEAPKYKKLLEKENKFLYAVSILRKSTGRGKSRKAGGLISIQLPNDDEAFDSVEDAQNKVAAFALWQLFPDLPLDQLLTKSYSLFVIKWQEELSFEPKDTDCIRREDFVDSLLDARTTGPGHSLGAASEIFEEPDSLKINHDSPSEKPHIFKSANTGMNHHEEAESLALKMELENKMKLRSYKVPEMLRMPLTELCLQIKSLSLGEIKSFLLEAIEPPREDTISSAVDLLRRVGAFEGNEELSPLGYHLAKLPVDVMVGKMLLYGAIFGCLSPILSVAAFLSHKSPFVYTKDEKQNVERAKATLWSDSLDIGTTTSEGKRQSDHLLMAVAYSKWAKILHENGVKAAQQFCRSFFLNSSVMYMAREMRIQFGSLLADVGLLNLPKFVQSDGKRKDKLDSWLGDISRPFNIYANHSSVIKSILCAGLYPNVAATTEGIFGTALGSNKGLNIGVSTKDHPIWYDGRREVHIHPSSINYRTKGFRYPFLVFLEKVETSKIFLRDTSIISPYSILLFGGSILVQHQAGVVIIDGWLKLNAPAQTAVLFKELRVTLHAVLKELIRKPEMAIISNNEVLRSIVHLLLEEDNA